jgi:S-adenosylmethionine hydrolase
VPSETPIITLTTDFGSSDGFVGIVKGVILSLSPQARLVDLSHDIASWDVGAASWIIWNGHRFFPPGTIHLCVVDPAVGSTSQRGIILTDGSAFFVGPDNGIFTLLLEEQREWRSIELTNKELWRKEVSATFHTRDIYGPVCAHLANGKTTADFGAEVPMDTVTRLPVQKARQEGNAWEGSIVYIDKFGNMVSNIPAQAVKPGWRCSVKGAFIAKVGTTYASAPKEEFSAFVGSHGYLEVGAYQANAAEIWGGSVGASVRLEPT